MAKDLYTLDNIMTEPGRETKSYFWSLAISFQKMSGLAISDHLKELIEKNLNNELSFAEIETDLLAYYKEKSLRGEKDEKHTKEADIVATRMVRVLSYDSLPMTADEFCKIHRKLFDGISIHAGKYRVYDIDHEEPLLNGDKIIFGNFYEGREALNLEFKKEKKGVYNMEDMDGVIRHIAILTSAIWRIHPFVKGNTRMTALYLIMFLNSKRLLDGFNPTFETDTDYFRGALVRSCYKNYKKEIIATTSYLELFLRNFILGEHNKLRMSDLQLPKDKEKDE